MAEGIFERGAKMNCGRQSDLIEFYAILDALERKSA
jgi:hypothetical protein